MRRQMPETEIEEVHYDLDLFFRLFSFVRPYAGLFTLALLASLLTAAFELYLPIITKNAIDFSVLKQAFVLPAEPSESKSRFQARYPGAIRVSLQSYLVPKTGRTGVVKNADSALYYYLRRNETTGAHWLELVQMAETRRAIKVSPEVLFIRQEDLKALPAAEVKILRASDRLGLLRLALLFMAILFCNLLANILLAIVLQLVGQRVMRDLRIHLLDHVMGLSISFYTKNPVGRLVTRLTNDVEALSEFYTVVLVTLFKDILLIGGIAFIIARFNPHLSLFVWGMTPFLIAVTVIFRVLARDAYRVIRRKIAEINASIAESLSGIKVIKLFSREAENSRRFARLNHEAYLANFRQVTIFAAFQPMINLMNYTAVAFIIYFGGQKVLADQLSLGAWTAFVAYVGMFFAPIADLAEKYNNFQGAMAAAEKLFNLLKVNERIPEPDRPVHSSDLRGTVEFRNVWHSYEGSQFVLEDVSFRVEPGQTVALVGPTGSGKTSITNLILRFYDPMKGTILIDGVDSRQMTSQSLRSRMAIVQQDVFLFATDIKGNIRLHNN
ncbi:MAG: ABC transporter ATP-binding protein, partial [bacterium]